ncbi:signal recognition particle subunit SEC65 [Bradyrhizobium sp. USDA 4516]
MIGVALIGIGMQSCRRSPSFEKIASKIQQLNVQNKRKQTNKSERTYPRREWRRCCLLVRPPGIHYPQLPTFAKLLVETLVVRPSDSKYIGLINALSP